MHFVIKETYIPCRIIFLNQNYDYCFDNFWQVDSLVENLSCTLQSVSALTVDTVETYRDGVCKTCDEVDNNIKAMYQLMAKWEELNKNMAPAYRVASQIKDIKRLLEMFEAALG